MQELDDARQLRNLANAVRFADSFSLLFVRCNQRPRQREIIEKLVESLEDCNIEIIFFENAITDLLDELQNRLKDKNADAVFVYGLESSFSNSENPAASPFVATLNHSRNSFKKTLSCPLVLFLPEYALSAVYHGATDFFTIRSGVYLFSAKAEETEKQIERHTSEDYRELQGLFLEERQNRIETIKDLLAEYQSLPVSQRNLEKESRLKEKLAELYYITGDYEKAKNLYLENLEFVRKNDDETFLLHTSNHLARVYQLQGNYQEAIKLYKQALEIVEKTIGKEHPDYASGLNNLALVYESQGRYEEAIKLYKQAIEIGEKTIGKEHPDYAIHLNNLANVYQSQGSYDEAINLCKQAIEIDEKTIGKDHPSYAIHLSNLALVYESQGNYDEAIKLCKQAIEIDEKTIGKDHPSYAIHLSNLANVYERQGKYREALELFEQALRIDEKTLPENHPYTRQDRESVARCREKLAEEMRNNKKKDRKSAKK